MFTLDIETILWFRNKVHEAHIIHSRKDKRFTNPEKIQENIKSILDKAALSPLTGQVIVGGITDENNIRYIHICGDNVNDVGNTDADLVIWHKDEKELITKYWEEIAKKIRSGELLISWNGKSFDIPFLFMRSIIHNIKPPSSIDYDGLIHPYRNYPHIDLKSMTAGSMDAVMSTLGFSDSIIDGEDVAKYWVSDPVKVINKCVNDLDRNIELFRRMQPWLSIKMNSPVQGSTKELW